LSAAHSGNNEHNVRTRMEGSIARIGGARVSRMGGSIVHIGGIDHNVGNRMARSFPWSSRGQIGCPVQRQRTAFDAVSSGSGCLPWRRDTTRRAWSGHFRRTFSADIFGNMRTRMEGSIARIGGARVSRMGGSIVHVGGMVRAACRGDGTQEDGRGADIFGGHFW